MIGKLSVDQEQAELRKKFITALGGSLSVSRRLGKSSHTVVSNWIRNGFSERDKPGLIELANDDGVTDIPEEVTTRKQLYQRLGPTPLNVFIKQLAKAYGGWAELHVSTGIAFMSLKSMAKRSVRLMPSHVPALEKAAMDIGVPLPEFWGDAREAYRRLEEKRLRRAEKRRYDDDIGA